MEKQELDTDSIEMFIAILRRSDELSMVLRSHLYIESLLDEIITRKLPNPNKLKGKNNLKFSFKVDLAEALGILPEDYASSIRGFNGIRNNFSHKKGYVLTDDKLSCIKVKWNENQKNSFCKALQFSRVEGLTTGLFYFLSSLRKIRDNI